MPGITSVSIDTQGKLGSVISATINFKCWDKMQLDVMDALYFKLGFTMFLEWGHTMYYLNDTKTPDKLESSELLSIDPFQSGLSKEDIYFKIAQNRRESEGNYDAMLGIVTNFNFKYTQDGGYDCTLKLMSLGILADSIKINNPGSLPGIVKAEVVQLNNTLIEIAKKQQQDELNKQNMLASVNLEQKAKDEIPKSIEGIISKFGIYAYSEGSRLNINANAADAGNSNKDEGSLRKAVLHYPSNKIANPKYADISTAVPAYGDIYIIRKLNGYIPLRSDLLEKSQIVFDSGRLNEIIRILIKNKKDIYSEEVWKTNYLSNFVGFDSSVNLEYPSDNGLNYNIKIKKNDYAITNNTEVTDKNFRIPLNEFVDSFINYISDENNKIPIKEYTRLGEFAFDLKIPIIRSVEVLRQGKVSATLEKLPDYKERIDVKYELEVELLINDTSLIKNFSTEGVVQPANFLSIEKKIEAQNQIEITRQEKEDQQKEQKEQIIQIENALNIQSSLELTLRAIQLHALNKAINQTSSPDINIGNKVYKCEFWKKTDLAQNSQKPFLEQVFSSGVYTSFIRDLVEDKISDSNYYIGDGSSFLLDQQRKNPTPIDKFKVRAKYGFATTLMSNNSSVADIQLKKVDYKELINAYVLPYSINQEIIKGIQTNHPVYIPFGLLLMILNHSCTIYDTPSDTAIQTPLVYIDYNPELNFCLSNSKQLSTNPWKTLIPFQGTFNDYKKLFSHDLLSKDGTNISGTSETTKLFNPETEDKISGAIPTLKFATSKNSTNSDSNNYRAKVMNILINIDYAIELVKDFSTRDTNNSVFLKPYIEQILSDLNKYLGNINAFRLSYNDQGNTFQIIDDQFIPALSGETQISPNNTTLTQTNTTEIPLIGKKSIAKSLEISTDISSKLSNMLAISANSTVANKATLSTNGDPFGFINTNYEDRYIKNRQEISGSNNIDNKNESLVSAATQFNQAISDFYSVSNLSENLVSPSTNYYIEKMSKIKNDEYPTRASTMIPVSINFTTDGISGLGMGHGFTVSSELLPYTYNQKKVSNNTPDYINNVGFVMVGLSHTIEGNTWNTSIKGNMILLKNKTDFDGDVINISNRIGTVGINLKNENQLNNPGRLLGQVDLSSLQLTGGWEEIAFNYISSKEGFYEVPAWDANHLRGGYGSDNIILASGQNKEVDSNTRFTREDAKRTLIWNIKNDYYKRVITKIGIQQWEKLKNTQKAALISYTYNVGSILDSVAKAIQSGESTAVANAIASGPITSEGKVVGGLITRRREEATLYLS
jgi:GH24 family phage-related lysozyme (muramidase)